MRVHTRLGPGLLESTYRRCLVRELRKAGIRCDTERRVSVRYEDETLPNSYRADIVAEDILGRPQRRDYRVVPRVTFTDPEVASVGLTEDAARRSGADVTTSVVRIADNERARIDGVPYGIVKLIQDTSSRELLGGHIVADGAGSMIHEIVAAMSGRLPASRLEDSIHAYPTLASSVRDAAAALDGS
jgi:pyruvate/2-oxoglutarate dehydrogenase complex dihydrolipoamide dehydrogenase (E3) component